ncbi:hypothetical protein [Paenibacillus elgii]|uniref:hypothetical protein n=1 Tax=Paenibacillus elgii TaxID=189691 RepID=UPI00203F444E|nr:hypothetical protein [Paenibacillus elgii]MCM3272127.1 hypothetical protein [Paenibacillus elgii]
MSVKLYKVKNKFSNYGLNSYLVVEESSAEAIRMAGEKLKQYALETNHTYDKKAYEYCGLRPVDIFDHIDKPTFWNYFTVQTLSEDILTDNVINVWLPH